MSTGPQPGHGTIDDLLKLVEADLERLVDIDPEALREESAAQTQAFLDTLAGKTIRSAKIELTRIVIETTDGNRYFFYGFMGAGP